MGLKVWANPAEDATPETSSRPSSSAIDTVIPNRSYLLKLDCISCPYLVRRANRNEWEQDPRPNLLTLALYIDDPNPRLYLQGEHLNPLWYERRAPTLYNLPRPFAPPFTANQIGLNRSLQLEENRYGIPIRQFELAYKFEAVTYAPKDRVQEWEALIEFEITGLRHEEHVPKDIQFFSDQPNQELEGGVTGVTSVVRIVLGYTKSEEMIITALELMPKDTMPEFVGKEIEAPLRKAVEGEEEKSITTANWGGRLRDINGPDGKDMFTDHVSFDPGEWNDCGRKDDCGRQIMCKLDDLKAWSPVAFVMSLTLLGCVLVGLFTSMMFVSWLAIRFLRGQKSGEVVTSMGENDALLLIGNEEFDEEEEKTEKEIIAARTLSQAVHAGVQEDSQQFGPFQHNIRNDI